MFIEWPVIIAKLIKSGRTRRSGLISLNPNYGVNRSINDKRTDRKFFGIFSPKKNHISGVERFSNKKFKSQLKTSVGESGRVAKMGKITVIQNQSKSLTSIGQAIIFVFYKCFQPNSRRSKST